MILSRNYSGNEKKSYKNNENKIFRNKEQGGNPQHGKRKGLNLLAVMTMNILLTAAAGTAKHRSKSELLYVG